MRCDMCHKEVEKLYRVVIDVVSLKDDRVIIDTEYNVINKRALWSCMVCYKEKGKERLNL